MTQTTSRLVRLARLRDADLLADMSRRLVEAGLMWRWRTGRIRQAIVDPETTVIIAEDQGRVSGFALFTCAETHAHLSLMAVDRQYQRRGVASTLINWLVQSCRVAGIGLLTLEVRSDNAEAISLYLKRGFTRCGIRRGYYDGREDAVRMSLTLIDPEVELNRPK